MSGLNYEQRRSDDEQAGCHQHNRRRSNLSQPRDRILLFTTEILPLSVGPTLLQITIFPPVGAIAFILYYLNCGAAVYSRLQLPTVVSNHRCER